MVFLRSVFRTYLLINPEVTMDIRDLIEKIGKDLCYV